MTFQAYLDTIKRTTGLDPADFRAAALAKGLDLETVTATTVYTWLAEDYGLGRGHAMAIFSFLRPTTSRHDPAAAMAKQFAGARAPWRTVFDDLVQRLRSTGPVELAPTNTYVSLLKGSAKFAVVAVTSARMDIGIKLAGVQPAGRLEAAGSWNSMVTHRVRIAHESEIDAEVLDWLERAYAAA